MKFKQERMNPSSFATIKEYLRVGGNYKGISEVTGLGIEQIKDIDRTRYYKDYMKKQDEFFIGEILAEEPSLPPPSFLAGGMA